MRGLIHGTMPRRGRKRAPRRGRAPSLPGGRPRNPYPRRRARQRDAPGAGRRGKRLRAGRPRRGFASLAQSGYRS
ncbi:MAG TPA: hypothetical protein VNH22_01245 [Blastocatellia bacterium]|nr:hypothetical protein [Blastocatellia bacterium]